MDGLLEEVEGEGDKNYGLTEISFSRGWSDVTDESGAGRYVRFACLWNLRGIGKSASPSGQARDHGNVASDLRKAPSSLP